MRLRFFRCRVCEEKDLRIRDLQEQISLLREMVPPQTRADRIPVLLAEADGVLSGRDAPIDPTADQLKELERIESEANRILSGTY